MSPEPLKRAKILDEIPSDVFSVYKEAGFFVMLDFIGRVSCNCPESISELFDTYSDHDIIIKNWKNREIFTRVISWAIPSIDSINTIVDFANGRKILEIGAGLGMWSRLIADIVGKENVIATDKESKIGFTYHQDFNDSIDVWYDVEQIDAHEAVKKYDAECLFICWGSCDFDDVISSFKGDCIIVIGEGKYGCTYYLSTKKHPEFQLVKIVDIHKWYGLNDAMHLYVRNNKISDISTC